MPKPKRRRFFIQDLNRKEWFQEDSVNRGIWYWTLKEFRRGPYLIKHRYATMATRGETPTLMKMAYTDTGFYIGETGWAYRCWKNRGITLFEPRVRKSLPGSICSVGYNPRKKKWYGWSHRAIAGFRKGQRKKLKNMPFEGKRTFIVKDPRAVAAAFAREVA